MAIKKTLPQTYALIGKVFLLNIINTVIMKLREITIRIILNKVYN